MSLTETERIILEFSARGLSDYKIGQIINMHPPSMTRSRRNACKKITDAKADLEWIEKTGMYLIIDRL